MSLIRGNALSLPLADESVDLVVTSPPYWSLRSYTDGGEHYQAQIGSEQSPHEFIDNLLTVTRECARVLKPSGSIWVNLGDKYSGSGGPGGDYNAGGLRDGQPRIEAQAYWSRMSPANNGIRAKSLMGLPWRYALGCIDDLGLILRAEVIWSKPNGLPESVTDRVRRSHENWFHFTREPRYFSAVDEVREPHEGRQSLAALSFARDTKDADVPGQSCHQHRTDRPDVPGAHPLGKLPGSVWTIPTEPLRVPDHLPQHFAAFPSEWPRRIILGWSPSGICVECGEGRRPLSETTLGKDRGGRQSQRQSCFTISGGDGNQTLGMERVVTITGESCACPTPDAPTRPAVVADPFCGTGTTVAVANALGRHGIGVDLSADYLRVARWRCADPKLRAKVLGVAAPPSVIPGQGDLFSPPSELAVEG